MECSTRPVAPYVIELDEQEKTAYQRLRIHKDEREPVTT